MSVHIHRPQEDNPARRLRFVSRREFLLRKCLLGFCVSLVLMCVAGFALMWLMVQQAGDRDYAEYLAQGEQYDPLITHYGLALIVFMFSWIPLGFEAACACVFAFKFRQDLRYIEPVPVVSPDGMAPHESLVRPSSRASPELDRQLLRSTESSPETTLDSLMRAASRPES